MTEVRFDDSFLGATVDFLLSFVGVSIVLFPAIGIGNALLGPPLADATVRLFVGVLAVGGSYPFVAGDWSVGNLGEFIFAFAGSAVLVGLLLAVGIAALDLQFSGANPVPQAVLAAASYLAAFLFVGRQNR